MRVTISKNANPDFIEIINKAQNETRYNMIKSRLEKQNPDIYFDPDCCLFVLEKDEVKDWIFYHPLTGRKYNYDETLNLNLPRFETKEQAETWLNKQ